MVLNIKFKVCISSSCIDSLDIDSSIVDVEFSSFKSLFVLVFFAVVAAWYDWQTLLSAIFLLDDRLPIIA